MSLHYLVIKKEFVIDVNGYGINRIQSLHFAFLQCMRLTNNRDLQHLSHSN